MAKLKRCTPLHSGINKLINQYSADPCVIKFLIDKPSLILPFEAEEDGGQHNCWIQWDVGEPWANITQARKARHLFSTGELKTVSIVGQVDGFSFGSMGNKTMEILYLFLRMAA